MPHIIVKLYPGRSQEKLQALADAITQNVMEIAGCGEDTISVAIEEITPEDWPETVYKPDILEKQATLYRKPGYNPFS